MCTKQCPQPTLRWRLLAHTTNAPPPAKISTRHHTPRQFMSRVCIEFALAERKQQQAEEKKHTRDSVVSCWGTYLACLCQMQVAKCEKIVCFDTRVRMASLISVQHCITD